MSVARALAAVDVQDLAGDERRVLQVEHRVDDVVDLADAADRVQCRQERRIPTAACIGVLMMPRATALERIPRVAYSMASARVAAFRPPLVNEASADGTSELACSTSVVEMVTRCPPSPCSSIWATAARETSKKPRRFTPVMASYSSSV